MDFRDLWMSCSFGYLVTIAPSTLVTFFLKVKVPHVTKLLNETHGKLDLAPKFTIWQIKRTTCTPISGTATAIRGSAAAANHVCIPAIKRTVGVRVISSLKWWNYLFTWMKAFHKAQQKIPRILSQVQKWNENKQCSMKQTKDCTWFVALTSKFKFSKIFILMPPRFYKVFVFLFL